MDLIKLTQFRGEVVYINPQTREVVLAEARVNGYWALYTNIGLVRLAPDTDIPALLAQLSGEAQAPAEAPGFAELIKAAEYLLAYWRNDEVFCDACDRHIQDGHTDDCCLRPLADALALAKGGAK